MRRLIPAVLAAASLWVAPPTARAQGEDYTAPMRHPNYTMNRFFYYPYYYFPHSYWPQNSPKWPEPQGAPYMRPPAYMAYPPFMEPHWRYEWYQPQTYHRGFHFWLDQF